MSGYGIIVATNQLGTGDQVDKTIVSIAERGGEREALIMIATPHENVAETVLTVATCDELIDALTQARAFLTGADDRPKPTRTLERDGPVPPKMTTVELQAYTRTINELAQRAADERAIADVSTGGTFSRLMHSALAEAFGIAADAVRAHRDRRDQRR